MPAPAPRNLPNPWTNPEIRQRILQKSDWAAQVGPMFELSEPGLPQNCWKWRNADKYAYMCLLNKDPHRVAAAFGLTYQPRPPDLFDKAKHDAESIAGAFSELQRILGRFEDMVRTRWRKKKVGERAVIVQRAWPGIPNERRPDLRCLRESPSHAGTTGTCHRDVFLFPHISIEELAGSPSTFLRLLNARGRKEPSVFVMSDLDGLQIGLRAKRLPMDFIPFPIDLSSAVASGWYGAIRSQTEEPEELKAVCGQRAIAASDGIHVLQVQARLLVFLRDCCKVILHDKLKDIDDDRVAIRAEPGPLPAHDEKGEDLIWTALQRPYRAPRPVVDLEALLCQAKAALEEGQEHLWALREDPSYWASFVDASREHSYEYILGPLGRPHNRVFAPDHRFLDVAVRGLLLDAHGFIFNWEMIVSLLQQVIEQERSFAASGKRFEEDSFEYFELLIMLRIAIDAIGLPMLTRRVVRHLPYQSKGGVGERL